MQTKFNATVSVSGTSIPDFKTCEVVERLGIAEQTFRVEVDRPLSVTTSNTLSVSYSIGGGASYPLLVNKKIEAIEPSTQNTVMSGAGSLLTRYSPHKSIIFINETWLKSAYPRYFFRDGIVYQQDPGYTPVRYQGVSTLRLFAPELPGKDTKDFDFECILQPAISYYTIAQYIGQKVGYTVNVTCPTLYVQKTFAINASEPYFSALARLYSIFNPMMYLEDTVIYIVDIGGKAQEKLAGTKTVKLTEDSFSLLRYNVIDNEEVVDHVLITGPTSNWVYRYKSALSTARIHRSEVDLPGEEEILVYEANFETDTSDYLNTHLQKVLNRSGATLGTEKTFEYANNDVEKNGRFVRTVKMVYDYLSNDSAVKEETTETYNVGGDLVSKIQIQNKWADFKTPVGHTKMEWKRVGKVQGGQTESNEGGYKVTSPTEYEFVPTSAEVVIFGDFIGETGQRVADIEEYNRVAYYKDEDTVTTGGSEEDVYVMKRPQIEFRNSMMGITPSTWEENEDDSTLGWQATFLLTKREKVRFDRASRYLLRKTRFVEEFYPVHTTRMFTEDIPLRKMEAGEERITKKWEFFCLGGNPDSIVQWDGSGNIPQPTPGGPGTVPGQPATFHPMVTVSCPDLIDDWMARNVARRIFHKRTINNTMATIRTTVPIPGVKIGSIFDIPACTKQYFDWNTKVWTNVTLAQRYMWVTGVRTVISFEGDKGSLFRNGEIYTEFELREKF